MYLAMILAFLSFRFSFGRRTLFDLLDLRFFAGDLFRFLRRLGSELPCFSSSDELLVIQLIKGVLLAKLAMEFAFSMSQIRGLYRMQRMLQLILAKI